MAETHESPVSQALATLMEESGRVSRIPDGFGDFCFAPKPFSCVDCSIDAFHRNFVLTRNTANAPDVDISEHDTVEDLSNGDIPESPFPFLELPKDIRHMIYEYFIAPFRNPWQNNGIKVQIGIVYNRRCHPFRNDYEMRIPVAIKPPKILYRIPDADSSSESGDESNSEFDDEPNGESDEQPNNQPPNPPKDEHYHLKRSYYDNIWALSKVNHQIRAELGSLFWENVYVDIDHFEYLLLDFLKDRPAVHAGIKKLRMSWDCSDDETELDDAIIDFCSYVSQHLVLDELIFVLCTSPAVARRILATEGDLEWIRAVREINAKTLKLVLFLCNDEDDDSEEVEDEEEEEEERYARLGAELGPKMELLLKPKVPVVEATDEDDYLMSRGL